MKSRTVALLFLSILAAAAIIGLIELQGCSADQLNGFAQHAETTKTALVGSPTTAPSAYVSVGESIVPAATPWVNIAGSVIGLAGIFAAGLAGVVAKNKSAQATVANTQLTTAKVTLNEVFSDIAAFKQPGVSFSAAAEKFIADVVGVVAAAPVATTPIEVTGLTPAAAANKAT